MVDSPGPGTQVHVGGAVSAQMVVGNHNYVVNLERTYIVGGAVNPPTPSRRATPEAHPLPRAGGELLGRRAELALLSQWVDEEMPVVVYGTPGVGKSALLGRFAADRRESGSTVVFLHAAGLDVGDVIQQLFQAFYDADNYLPDRHRLRRLMGSVHALIVIDDFDGAAEDLEELLDALPSGDLVVASRRRLSSSRGQLLELLGVDEDAGLALITRTLGHDLGENLEPARRLYTAARGHPRALVQAGAWLRRAGPAVAVADPDVLRTAMLTGLSAASRQVVSALLAGGGSALSPALCQVMTGRPAESILQELQELSLAESAGAGYRLSVDAVLVGTAWAGSPPDPSGFLEPLLEWATSTATAKQVGAASPVLIRVLDTAITDGNTGPACSLARTIAPVLAATLQWGAWREVLKLGAAAAAASGSAADRAYFENEDAVRQRAVNAVAGITVAGGAAGGVALGKAVTAWTLRKSLQTAISAHPAAAVCVATVAVGAAVAGATIVATEQPMPQTQPAALETQAPPPIVPAVTTTIPVTTSDTETTTRAKPTCTPESRWLYPNPFFTYLDEGGISGVPGSATIVAAYTLWQNCDNVVGATIQGDAAFTINSTKCQPAVRRCDFAVTFAPPRAGEYHATFVIHTQSGQSLTGAALTGVASKPGGMSAGPSTTSTPPPSTTDSGGVPRLGPTEPPTTSSTTTSTTPPTSTPPTTTS
ncbi:ATP-binding protein [Nocardia sp. NPDC004860]|uniref:ATP-binding protein n=1 Tax=Nocardia sp. NPDC004860 TaxID=3154557 RepID=UPI0033B955D3